VPALLAGLFERAGCAGHRGRDCGTRDGTPGGFGGAIAGSHQDPGGLDGY
jgi:hypothetical protein